MSVISLNTSRKLGVVTSTLLKNKSCSVFFLKKEFLSEGYDAFKIELDEVRLVEELT